MSHLGEELIRILFDFVGTDGFPRLTLSGRIADPGREITEQEDDFVPVILEMTHHPEVDGVADMKERGRDIHPVLDAQRPVFRQLASKFLQGKNFVRGPG